MLSELGLSLGQVRVGLLRELDLLLFVLSHSWGLNDLRFFVNRLFNDFFNSCGLLNFLGGVTPSRTFLNAVSLDFFDVIVLIVEDAARDCLFESPTTVFLAVKLVHLLLCGGELLVLLLHAL